MTTDDPVLTQLADANPVPRTARPGPYERGEADRILQRVLSAPPRPRRRPQLLPAVSVLVAIVVVVVAVLSLHGSGPGQGSAPRSTGLQIVLRAEPTPRQPVTPAAISRAVAVVRERLRSIVLATTTSQCAETSW